VDKHPQLERRSAQSPREAVRARFREFSEAASSFSREVTPSLSGIDISEATEQNLRIAKTVFGKWSLEILVLLYTMKELGFEKVRKSLRRISPRVLSEKLKQLEAEGLIRREVLSVSPPRVNYMLTERGLIVARLGEPVFLFLRHESS
jgi:DNA-binding HxlR family transcriptional regulator